MVGMVDGHNNSTIAVIIAVITGKSNKRSNQRLAENAPFLASTSRDSGSIPF